MADYLFNDAHTMYKVVGAWEECFFHNLADAQHKADRLTREDDEPAHVFQCVIQTAQAFAYKGKNRYE